MTLSINELSNMEASLTEVNREMKHKITIKPKTNRFMYSFPDDEFWNEISVGVLYLSKGSENCLKSGKITKLGELTENFSVLETLRNCGKTRQNEIKKAVFDYYFNTLDDEHKIAYIVKLYCLNNGQLEIIETTEEKKEVA